MNAPFDVTGVELGTERLTLRPWRQSDLNDFFEYASVDGVGQMAGWLPHKDAQETQKILDSFIEKKKTFALDYQGKVIGSLGVEYYDEKEALPENEEFVRVNNKETLAQVFTDLRYTKKDNEAMSATMLDALRSQGFLD